MKRQPLLALLMVLASTIPVYAQPQFFEGKTIRIIVCFSAGGGYDTYSRTIARHLSRHIPGNPTVIVENMTGAVSLLAANHAYKIAKPDGLTIVNFHGNQVVGQLLGREGIEFDARKFKYVGIPMRDSAACALTKACGITSLEQWAAAKTPVKLGAVGPGDTSHDVGRVLQTALGLPIQLVRGYKGTAEIRLAAESGEVAGGCWQWESVKVTWRKALDAGDIAIVLQVTAKPLPDLPGVPMALDLAKTDEGRRLREAFLATLRDPEFLADARQARLDVDPLGSEELERLVEDLFRLEPPLAAK